MNIAIALSLNDDGLLLATTEMDKKEVGTIGDNNAQTLTFDRGDLTGGLQLSFLTANQWQTADINMDTTYTIPNSLTSARSLILSVALIDGDTVITGANRLEFFYRPGGDVGSAAPSTIDSEWVNVKNNAMLTTVYDTDKDGVIDYTALPLSSVVDSDSEETAATSAAVKEAYDLANTANDGLVDKASQEDLDTAVESVDLLNDSLVSNYGGTNLLLGSKDFSGMSSQTYVTADTYMGLIIAHADRSSASATVYNDFAWNNSLEPEPGTWYTLSFRAKGTGVFQTFFYPNSTAQGVSSAGATTTSADGKFETEVTSEWKRYWISWKTRSDISGVKNIIVARVYGGNDIYMCGVQFERGQFVHDWNYSPNDISSIVTRLTNAEAAIVALGGTI